MAALRVVLVHWNEAEYAERRRRLEAAGFEVGGGPTADELMLLLRGAPPPDALVVDLGRLPSHGREIAGYCRERKALRTVPLVFVDGEPAKVAATKARFPDADYCTWAGAAGAIRRAASRPPRAEPATPRSAGYSGTPLPKKLGLAAGKTLALLSAPPGFEALLQPPTPGLKIQKGASKKFDVAVAFVSSTAEIEKAWDALEAPVKGGASAWIAWRKKTPGVRTEIGEADVRAAGLARGVVDVKVCAIDAAWSGLKFTARKPKK